VVNAMLEGAALGRTNVVFETTAGLGEEVPDGVRAIYFHRRERVYDVTDRFGHLFPSHGPMRMYEKSFWKRETESHKDCREV
jgi:hypothetical protein